MKASQNKCPLTLCPLSW